MQMIIVDFFNIELYLNLELFYYAPVFYLLIFNSGLMFSKWNCFMTLLVFYLCLDLLKMFLTNLNSIVLCYLNNW